MENISENETHRSELPSNYIASLKKCITEEKQKYAEAQNDCKRTKGKLQLALKEIEMLNEQIINERKSYQERFEEFRKTCYEKDCKYFALQDDLKALEEHFKKQVNITEEKDILMEQLKSEIKFNRKKYRELINEKNVHCQQERYIKQHYFSSSKNT